MDKQKKENQQQDKEIETFIDVARSGQTDIGGRGNGETYSSGGEFCNWYMT